ncbi:MAG: PD-(D/E)XK nuclease family protein [Chlamydiota bacterium]|nr:PD-(D/E)XK nuclease family protein [Chlamydiota bacterium]
MKTYGIDAVPFQHEDIEIWRDGLRRGITYLHPQTNLILTGGIDDVWQNRGGELLIVDYKATSKDEEVNLDAAWQDGYKRQMEIYQWLFRKNGFKVSSIGYFVYCNGDTDKEAFDGKLEFDVKIIPYAGNDDWIDPSLRDAFHCLNSNGLPVPNPNCDYCLYRESVRTVIDAF